MTPILIRDLIEIPERVHKGDFVLRLSEGVAHPAETLRSYVVTDQLRDCFEQALGLVHRALDGHRSMGAFLHGSFGSGKSHFMAVLHLLLQHDPEARSIAALAPVLAKNAWAEGKRFLLVPYHLMGATSLEQAVLGHYVGHVRQLHPEAPLPAVYLAEPIFANATDLRIGMGDEAFFARLNSGKQSGGGWGKFATGVWDGATFAEATTAAPADELRLRLLSDLVARLFPAYKDIAASGAEVFVPLDRGLSVISRHAHALGYQGLVLFLDELILWLASRVADLAFITREGAKVAKLVESETADRPAPIISFIARQRDLRELVGDHLPGAEKLSFSDTLKWSEGRFDTITLDDRNLPAIAKQRLLRPKDDDAERAIDKAFDETRRVRADVLDALLGREGNPETFRDVYPFSPALVQALVAISSVLQRERTALRVMLQLLVDQRDTLRLGDLVPLGDLFDVIAEGDEPFTEEMRIHFERAKRLYYQKLLPMLERQHQLGRDEARSLPHDDPRAASFRADDRLVKSLLLAALTPEVETLKGLTAGRLAALNHGSIRAPIPGGEPRMVLNRCRPWAAQVGEIKIGDDPTNPTIAIHLSGVDTERIVEKARIQDNAGNRKRALRILLFGELGLPVHEELFLTYTFPWRGTQRQVEVVFANIRELANDSLRAKGDDWKVVIDFPFDTEGHSSKDDLARLESFRDQEPDTATLCWVPAFFTHDSQRDLGTYVILDFLLTGERFEDYASHLAAVDRVSARSVLDSQRSQLKQRLISCLEAAYGIAVHQPGLVDSSLELSDRFQSLDRRFSPRPPVAPNLHAALTHLLDQIQSHRFPKHPRFETRIQAKELRRTLEVAVRAAHAPQGRVEVEKELRQSVRQVANPLRLGEMHEVAFVLADEWRHQLTRGAAAAGGTATVGELRSAIDQPEPLGLPREVQDLLILVFAEQTNRSFFRYGGAVAGDLGQLADDMELREQRLPTEATWRTAQELAAKVFGIAVPSFLSASNAALLRAKLEQAATELRAPCSEVVDKLKAWMAVFEIDPGTAPRMRTAVALQTLVEDMVSAAPDRILETLAAAAIATTAEAMGNVGKRARELVQGLSSSQLELLKGLRLIGDPNRSRGEAILADLRDCLLRDELAAGLVVAVQRAAHEGTSLLIESAAARPATPPPGPASPGWSVIEQETRQGLDASEAHALFEHLEATLREAGECRLRIAWTLERRAEKP